MTNRTSADPIRLESVQQLADIVAMPHSWAPRLAFADMLRVSGQPDSAARIEAMYSILNGCWGDAALHKAAAGVRYVTKIATMPFALIPPGSFVMGSPETEPGHRYDEAQVPVTLTHGFWLGVHTVPERVWSAPSMSRMCDATTCLPVTNISWYAIQEFLAKLNKQFPIPGWRYDLPTEAQWEYACRAGTNTAYAFGDTITKSQVNFASDGAVAPGHYAPNAFGLHDMHGNVWEWCRDAYVWKLPGGADPYVSTSPGNYRVLRGGSWYSFASVTRSANRSRAAPGNRSSNTGFRVALVVDV